MGLIFRHWRLVGQVMGLTWLGGSKVEASGWANRIDFSPAKRSPARASLLGPRDHTCRSDRLHFLGTPTHAPIATPVPLEPVMRLKGGRLTSTCYCEKHKHREA